MNCHHFSYYCSGGTVDPNPFDAECPAGNYCPEGSDRPIACPSGTIVTSLGNSQLSDCELCPPGQYCTPASSQSGKESSTSLHYL